MSIEAGRRAAARTATFVAVPLALAAFGAALLLPRSLGHEPRPESTGAVTTSAQSLSPDVAAACRRLIADLPPELAGRARRTVTAGPEQNAAYGDPAVTLACGAASPTVDATDVLFSLAADGADRRQQLVCWHRVALEDRTLWTTVDRTVPVAVTVPGPLDGSFLLVSPLSSVIGTDLPRRADDELPAGCFS